MLRAILSSADVFLYPSRSEGSPLMVMEAFACRCPVVTTEAVPYAMHRINAMVSKVGDIDSLADDVCHVLGSSELAGAIASHGYDYAQDHTLQSAKASFENTIKSIYERQHNC
jgi:glycosyltransferase involved in cell wall biosynthesis